MSHKETPHVSLSVLFASLIICIVFTLISFYSYKECSCKKCAKPSTVSINNNSAKYITVAGPNGDPVKVSSKMSALTAYIADDKSVIVSDATNSDKSFWQSKFKEWREKMSQNSVTPSLTNFMDIVELSKIVKEN
ncbi:MAG TPA: hypothetical protein VK705_07870 [Ferruginibacter sp.]|jgi:hypothetical protein|nr:hypothetical protein [Ferruginibacter sp.]